MRDVLVVGSIVLAVSAAFACSGTSEPAQDEGDLSGDASMMPDPGTTPLGPAGSGLATGLPCDVQALLENRCIGCHDGKSQFAMLNYDDLVAKSKSDPTKSIAEITLARMKDPASPMPPKPAAPPAADEIRSMADWVAAGLPREAVACTDPPPALDGGVSSGDGGADAGALTCTSGKKWLGGDDGSPLMHPGAACNTCHQKEGGPNLRLAGTVYPTAHEPDDCNGATSPQQIVVRVTDARNRTYTMRANAAGNFMTEQGGMRPPFRATVTAGTNTREMKGSVTSGDCNSCHTAEGKNGAPGRIMAP